MQEDQNPMKFPVIKYWYRFPEQRKAEARAALRLIAKGELFKIDDGMADVALEGLWNIMAGHNEE